MTDRTILLVAHTARPSAITVARQLTERLTRAGVAVRVLAEEHDALGCGDAVAVPADSPDENYELLIALGGDGTLLRAAELARRSRTPLLGVNLGHVGFLAEADPVNLDITTERILSGEYDVEERFTVAVEVIRDGEVAIKDWALNDVSVEKAARERIIDLLLEIDSRPLSRWACDGIICATPTGSTAYAFSVGGPVVWPEVQALMVVPISAHALFARALVLNPDCTVAIEMADRRTSAVMFCDGRRTHEILPGDRIEVSRSELPIRFLRLRSAPFTDRLVDKFQLPVQGWRGRADEA
jgi:NAD+ kinase